MVLLQHKFEIENKDGSHETRTSTLCEYGAPTGSGGYSAMAKLVGVPCAVGKSSRFLGNLIVTPCASSGEQSRLKSGKISTEDGANIMSTQLSNKCLTAQSLTRESSRL